MNVEQRTPKASSNAFSTTESSVSRSVQHQHHHQNPITATASASVTTIKASPSAKRPSSVALIEKVIFDEFLFDAVADAESALSSSSSTRTPRFHLDETKLKQLGAIFSNLKLESSAQKTEAAVGSSPKSSKSSSSSSSLSSTSTNGAGRSSQVTHTANEVSTDQRGGVVKIGKHRALLNARRQLHQRQAATENVKDEYTNDVDCNVRRIAERKSKYSSSDFSLLNGTLIFKGNEMIMIYFRLNFIFYGKYLL